MVKSLINKLLSLYVHLVHRDLEPALRYFCRDTYYCRLLQIKYFFKDYILRKPYKEISFSGEFTPDLAFVLPFAYWHHKNGTLKQTRAPKFTKELYFFSEDHEECFETRSIEGNYNYETPRILYSHSYKMSKWEKVPLKSVYQNEIYVFDKPVLVIANRYNSEWGGPPVSYFDIPMLDFLITSLKSDYTILYNRPRPDHITMDNSSIYDLNEYGWIKRTHPEVLLMEDLYRENKGKARNYNHFQLMVDSNCDRFISTHGGTAALASYFGGVNLILSKKGPEHVFGCFDTLYRQLSDATILHAKTDDDVKEYVRQFFVNKAAEPHTLV